MMKLQIFDGFTLKMIMFALMFMDHIYKFIPGVPMTFTYFGRVVAPVFYFLLVQSYIHTKNKKKLILRLFIFGAVMFFGSWALQTALPYEVEISNNIFLNMATSLLLLYILDEQFIKRPANKVKDKVFSGVKIAILLVFVMITEASIFGLAMILIFYYLKDKKAYMLLAYAAISLIFLSGGLDYQSLFIENYQWMMIFAIPFFLIYNGNRGHRLKYFFYIGYPLHIWILYSIGALIEMGIFINK